MRKVLSLANKLHIERKEDLLINEGLNYFLELKGVSQAYSNKKLSKQFKDFSAEDKKAFLRGVFLGCGILSSPPSYHLELRFEHESDLKIAQQVLQYLKIKNLVSNLRLYIKGRENIKRFLFEVKAQDTYLAFEDDAVKKEISNKANRKANFEFANLERQSASSAKILSVLEKVRDAGQLEHLRDDLKEVAILKLTNPFLPLSELAEETKGKYTKQMIYYRLKRIEKVYGK